MRKTHLFRKPMIHQQTQKSLNNQNSSLLMFQHRLLRVLPWLSPLVLTKTLTITRPVTRSPYFGSHVLMFWGVIADFWVASCPKKSWPQHVSQETSASRPVATPSRKGAAGPRPKAGQTRQEIHVYSLPQRARVWEVTLVNARSLSIYVRA